MIKFSNKFKKPCFLPILGPFSQFWGQKKFSWKIRFCHAQLYMGFQHYAKIQKKLMIQFKENTRTDGKKEGRTKGRRDRPYFYRTLPATAGGPKKQIILKQETFSLRVLLIKVLLIKNVCTSFQIIQAKNNHFNFLKLNIY